LPDEQFDTIVTGQGSELRVTLGVANAIAAFRSYGSTAPTEVLKQLAEWKQRLDGRHPPPPLPGERS
jgi:argininosuccinate lyase